MSGVIDLDQVRARAAEIERENLRKAMERMKERQGDEDALYHDFMHDDLQPTWREKLNRSILNAVEHEKNEIQVMRFPSSWCSDKGRAINNFESNWPSTLTGKAARGWELYQKELEPLGYKLKAQILNFPGGLPGDVGIFLAW
ncbi:MAG: hypothetical protein R3C97_05915 [Geminicoccaceae bacterium]|nr:hypothetical protein [Geminicoccaceae bacterium]